METKKNILVCPLDWGLGHATRCVPLIKQFLKEGHEVIIGADKNPLAFLQQEFPKLKTVAMPGHDVTYGKKGGAIKLFYESVKFFNFIREEHQSIDKIIEEHHIDMIISDNRYGLYSNKVESVIVTHQLFVKALIGESIVHNKIAQLLNKFNEVWIPDYEGEDNLSGDLAHLKPFEQKHKFIGPLSRFSLLPSERSRREDIEYDVCVILSGPEPQRTIFEKLILKQIVKHTLSAVVVRGLPDCTLSGVEKHNLVQSAKKEEVLGQAWNDDNIKIFNHLPTEELYQYIQKSKVVVCRAGYSSIMDLAILGKKAILVPTSGQTEQEYLAEYHKNNTQFLVQSQKEFDLNFSLG
jgi:UDP:flavonoid glycosyltransferase YjiC (YdhE family)